MHQPPRIFVLLGAAIPLGIGVTVLGFLWLTPFNQFGSPPLFFRIFASFIAFAFILTGAATVYGATTGLSPERLKELQTRLLNEQQKSGSQTSGNPVSYVCTSCGATLDRSADVSPHGDVKCAHCGKWFNIHSS